MHFKGVVLAASKSRAESLRDGFGFGEDWLAASPLILRNGALRGQTIENRVLLDCDVSMSPETRSVLTAALGRVRGGGELQVWGLR